MDSTGKKFGNVINNRLIQEWLCLHDIAVKIDGIFGPVTFQSRNNLKTDGIVGLLTHAILTDPVRRALKLIRPENSIPGKTIMAYAYRHLEQRPREIGGQNRGPWVRLYMGLGQAVYGRYRWARPALVCRFCIVYCCSSLPDSWDKIPRRNSIFLQ